mmetsp:Transcript_19762/g.42933  ORF Transcript_19762/g.42933 Transcript_19762/m.42933 type:complete len:768 (-) Transcript_19762:957-3260(-)|eukprot:CAMPEP_0202903338 /NCGR_PEP_ID=MMETSP1392-20130828/23911_1 /ASSEMBLY_ACC=CAM_ASM_000868 /TAXON_ID=225041 /ORGANISM="Chlamydomonas chlamydogama, Strain SAG 11-48b" /LENGTH=767 /DNA_ID=CAMNT_0049590467 /DNA_START=33 /DNA_END=2336 /DNA_ORIENTATION=-
MLAPAYGLGTLACIGGRLVGRRSLHIKQLGTQIRNLTDAKQETQAVLLSDITNSGQRTPILLGLVNYLQRHLPSVGFFQPISGPTLPTSTLNVDRHVELVYNICELKGDVRNMAGVNHTEAQKMIGSGKLNDLLDKVYAGYASYKDQREFTVVEGPGPLLGGTELDAQVAAALSTPVIMTINGQPRMSASDYFNLAMVKRQLFADHKAEVVGVALNTVPRYDHAIIMQQLQAKFREAGLTFVGGIPDDPMLSSIRLDEVKACVGAELLFGQKGNGTLLDTEFTDIIVASQRVEELLEILDERRDEHPLVVTSMDRLDIVLGLLAAHVSVQGPSVAGVLLTRAGARLEGRRYAKDTVSRIFKGIEEGGMYRGSLLPVLSVDKPMFEVMSALANMESSILPTSTRKISRAKMLFDKYIDANALIQRLQSKPRTSQLTPKMFQHNIKALCLNSPQHIVLPEALDKRILAAASEVTQRGLARVTLLGDPAAVAAEAKKLGVDISLCSVHNPENSDRLEKYAAAFVEARGKKAPSLGAAADMVSRDVNTFGVMMVHCGDADGMVSGAIHTTAATIRPAMQVLKLPGVSTLVSSVFFMCLPDRVLVYGDCAVNVHPTSEELAQIAMVSADTAAAFGVEPRVAMLSYSTLGSGAGPEVQRVTEAVAIVKKTRPDIKVEGPIQYDAAIDPAVAAVKVKGTSEVAGKATVFVFPDLNTGNNTYKAVQQSTGAIAMGPVMQGLLKPVNDLSRGCTVPDVVNTICVTSIQAMAVKKKA